MILALVFLLSEPGLEILDYASEFREGNRTYASGEIQDAASLFQKVGNHESVAPGLLHNLGNAEFKLGNLGPAILAWERAHSLDPWNRNTTANLRFARGQAALSAPKLAWNEKYSAWLPADCWLWTAAVCFWGGLACLALPPLLARRRTAWTQAGAVLALSTFILTLPALAGLWMRHRLGVVVAAEAPLRLTPTQEGEVLGKLSAGEVARVEITRGAYVYVRGENDRAGWVQAEEFARIWAR